jgi:hypothetical protein
MLSNASTSTETMTLGVSLEGAAQVLTDMIVLRETITLNSMLIVLNMNAAANGLNKPYKEPSLVGLCSAA